MIKNTNLSMAYLAWLWKTGCDIPVDQNDRIESEWAGFPSGTPREEIWHWFESQNPGFSVADAQAGKYSNLTNNFPMPGDAVILFDELTHKGKPIIGIIDGTLGKPKKGYAMTFNASAYRDRGYVECSGGPGSIMTPSQELVDTGLIISRRFWRWKDGIVGAGRGEDYYLKVPLWWWGGTDWFCGDKEKTVEDFDLGAVLCALDDLRIEPCNIVICGYQHWIGHGTCSKPGVSGHQPINCANCDTGTQQAIFAKAKSKFRGDNTL
jgi:hypothetical protein